MGLNAVRYLIIFEPYVNLIRPLRGLIHGTNNFRITIPPITGLVTLSSIISGRPQRLKS